MGRKIIKIIKIIKKGKKSEFFMKNCPWFSLKLKLF